MLFSSSLKLSYFPVCTSLSKEQVVQLHQIFLDHRSMLPLAHPDLEPNAVGMVILIKATEMFLVSAYS